jgi:hypothetical protein
MTRNEEFVRSVRHLRRSGDAAEITCTDFTGGGVRFAGFVNIAVRRFLGVLDKHGKRAVFRLDAHTGLASAAVLHADCYDNIDPQPLVPSTVADLNLEANGMKLMRARANYKCGAVVYAPYICSMVTSEMLQRLLLGSDILDVRLKPATLVLQSVSTLSTGIVGGLQSQLATAVRGRSVVRQRKIKFARNTPTRCGKVVHGSRRLSRATPR